jgi:purine-nucleoside phosphorylase
MEAAGLYIIAAKHYVDALSIFTISDSLVTEGNIFRPGIKELLFPRW